MVVLHIDMRGNTLYNVSDPVNPQDVATKKYADKVGGGEAAIIKTRYGTYGAIGLIDMRGYTLTNVLDPVNPQDVATKEYIDKVEGGETAIVKTRYGNYGAIGNIDMRGYTLTNVSDPVNPQDVATKEYADNKSHIIAVHASYHGPLIWGKYQFTFGGNESYSAVTGFLMPHSGRIKKMKLKGPFRQGSIVRPTPPYGTIIMKYLMFRIILAGPTGHVTTLSRVQCETVNYKDDIEPLNFRSNCHDVKFVDE